MTTEYEKKIRKRARGKGFELRLVTFEEKVFSVPRTFSMKRNNFFLFVLDEVTRLTVPFGIPQHFKNYYDFLTDSDDDRRLDRIDYTPKVLTVC